jgi:uncharacterized protein
MTAAFLDTVSREAWDLLAGGNFYSTSAWLSFSGTEPGAHSGAAMRYADGNLVGAVPVAELTASPTPLYRWNDLLSSFSLPTLPSRGLLVGPRQGYQTHFLVSESKPAETVVADLVSEIRQLRSLVDPSGKGACVAMYLTTRDVHALRCAGINTPPVLLGADAWLKVPPAGWPAWLNSQTSKHRAREIRREVRLFRRAGYKITHMSLSECYDKLAVAAASTQSKYGNVGQPEDYLALLRKYVNGMGSAAKVAVCSRAGDDPVGFCIYFIWHKTIFLRWCGFDYNRLIRGAAEYFNLLYYNQIELAAENGVRWIHAGIKSPVAKALRGAQLRPLWLVDLTKDSIFARTSDHVRQHNMHAYQRLIEDNRTAAALVDRDSWQAFF